MIARIFVSASLEQVREQVNGVLGENQLKNPHPDLLYLDSEQKLGVEQTKKIREFLSLRPYQAKGRAVVIEAAQNLTLDAQNSLLKILEEPPEEAIIVLGVEKEDQLITTILSRCQIFHLLNDRIKSVKARESEEAFDKDITKLLNSPIEQRFEYIEKLEVKEEFLRALVTYFRKDLKLHPRGVSVEFAKILIEAERWQKANVNIRAILEYLMLRLPEK